MKSIAIPCLDCGAEIQILLHDDKIFVAHREVVFPPRAKRKIKRNGGSGPEPLPCKECGRVFFRAASLGVHRRRAHGVKGKKP